MKSQLSGKKIFLLLIIMLLSTSVLHAVSADFFGTDTEAGEDSLRSKISSADASAELFEYHFTSSNTASALSPIEVTGSDGSIVYVKISRGDPPAANFNGYTYPVGHAHDGYGAFFMDDWSVSVPMSNSGWDEAVTEGVKFEFFSDNAMSTPTTINAFGTFTYHWGTCCTNQDNPTPTGTAEGSAIYSIFTTADGSSSINQIGIIPDRILADVHFVAEIDDSDLFTSVTLAPNGDGEFFAMGGYLLFSQVGIGSIPAGSGWTPSIAPSVASNPENNATGFGVSSNITLTFTEPVRNTDDSELTDSNVDRLIQLINRNPGEAAFNISFDATINSTKTVITINPSSDFSSEQRVEVRIGATIEDSDDNAITASSATFTCAAGGVPTAILNPMDGATDISTSSDITITFDEAVRNTDDSDITDSNVDALITLKKTNSSGAVIAFDATINVANTVITINPTDDFSSNQVVYAEIASVEDVTNNATTASSVTFTTTSNIAPAVTDIPDQTILEGGSFATISLDNYVSDAGTEDALMSWVATGQSNLTVSISSNREATITASTNWNGSEVITFTATDNDGINPMTGSDVATFTATPVNDAPVFTSTAITSATEDVLYSHTTTASDVDGDALTFAAATLLPTWLTGVDNGDGSASGSGTPGNGDVGDHYVVLTVSDGTVTVEQSFTITVENVNDLPVFSSTAIEAATEDVLYSYTVTASDDDGNALTFAATTLPTWLSFNVSTQVLSGTPGNGDVGDHAVVLTVNDSFGTVNQSFPITVANTNDAPVISSTTILAATEDVLYSYTVTASDIDEGDALTFAAITLPTWMTLVNNGDGSASLSGTPLNEHVGSNSVVLTVNDGTVTVEQSLTTITVANTNDAPVFSSTAILAATEDVLYSYPVTASDIDVGDALIFAATTLPTWLTLVDNGDKSASLSGTPDSEHVGDHDVTLTVSDGTTTVEQIFTITVNERNDPPEITSTAHTKATEDVQYSYSVQVTDPDDVNNGTDITFALTGAPEGMTVSNMGAIEWTPLNSVLTSGEVTLTVADGGEDGAAAATETFTITVTPVNDAPVFTSTAILAATEDVLYSYTVEASDIDVGDALTFAADTLPTWLTLVDNGNRSASLSGTPLNEHVGSNIVMLTVSDGTMTVEQSFTIMVVNTNDAPVFTSTPIEKAILNIPYSIDGYTVTASDVDGDALTFATATTLPIWLTLVDNGNGSASLSGTPNLVEFLEVENTVTLTITDETVIVEQTFTITVEAEGYINNVPLFTSSFESTTTLEDLVYSYEMKASDSDDIGDTLIFGVTTLPTWLSFDSTATISGTPLNEHVGEHTVILTVSDYFDLIDDTLTITVVNTNDTPEITSTAHTKATEDVQYSYSAQVTDPDPDDVNNGTDITFALTGAPEGMTVSNMGAIEWTPLNSVLTSGEVTLTVADGREDGAAAATETFTITVTPVNDAPVFTSTAILAATEDVLYSYTVEASDIDVGDALTFAADTLPTWLTLVDNGNRSASLSGTPLNEHVGSNIVMLTVSDGTMTAGQSFTIMVANTNDAPAFTSTTITNSTEDVEYHYTAKASDEDDDALTIAATTLPSWLKFFEPDTIRGTPNNNNVGDTLVVLTAFDGTAPVTQSFTITVANTNDAVEFSSTAITAATEDVLYSYPVTANDIDVGDALTFAADTLPTWLTLVDNGDKSASLSGTPLNEHVGTHNVVLTVSDASVTDEHIFTITVENVNDAPIFTSTTITSSTEDVEYSYTAKASDEDNDALTFATTTLPTWLSFDVNTQVLSGTPTNDEVGEHAVVFTVNDGTTSVDQLFKITVDNTNDEPNQFDLIAPQDSVIISDNNIDFYWQKSEDIDKDDILNYILYIEGTNSFSSDTIYEANIYSKSAQELIDISSSADFMRSEEGDLILKLEWYVACYDSISTTFSNHRSIEINISIIVGDNMGIDDIVLPNEYNLFNPYPNPFNPVTVINYAVPGAGQISISIYDIRGREVAKLYNGNQMPGYHTITWDASEYSSGMYFVMMVAHQLKGGQAGSYINTQKLLLVK